MTGSHGFVGSNLIEALAPDYEIIRWDVREDKPLPECDAVIHLAGIAHDTKHTTEAEKYYEVNSELTKRLYDQFLKSSTKIFIFFSSIKAQDSDTVYAKSKKAAEDYFQKKLKNESGKLKNKTTYILRPCMIHGKGNKGNLNLLVKWVKKGWPWPLAAFENKRSYASMENVEYVVSELLNKDVESGTYNICDDEAVSTNELIEIIGRCMGKDIKMIRVPQNIMRVIARVGGWLQLPLDTERLRKLTEDYIVDNSKIKKALGIKKMPIGAKDGLRLSIQSMIK